MNKHSHITSNIFRLAVLALAMAGAGNAIAAEAIATSTGTVLAPIAITPAANLSFGKFSRGTGGEVTVSTAGNRDKTGGVVLLPGTGSAARFDVVGTGDATYTINVVATDLTDGTNTMPFAVASALTPTAATTGAVTLGQLTAGAQSIYVGGVLNVAANQVAGVYAGTVTATVEYN